MKVAFTMAALLLALAPISRAQFSPAFLQNDSYWGDGKAEVDFYDAQVMRDGQLRHCELQVILAKTTTSVPREGPSASPPPAIPAIRMSQAITIPRGLVNEYRASALLFLLQGPLFSAEEVNARADDIASAHTTAGADAKEIAFERTSPQGEYSFPLAGQPLTILRNELPLRVRLLDLSKDTGEFDVRVIDALPPGETPTTGASSGKLSFKTQERTIEVEFRQEKETNKITVDRDFPFLLREWKTADGSIYKLKNSLKVDYQKYLKEGDREKALKDPMLRHPD